MSQPEQLWILNAEDRTLFDLEGRYVIPLYQRAYAWKEKEIVQLIHDLYDMEQRENTKYHLGSLIVARNGNEYEVIDGQQRLTTLYIILKCLWEKGALDRDVPNTLLFSCRDKSNYTLKHLSNLTEDDRIEENIRTGRKIVRSELDKTGFSVDRFVACLKKAILFRIEVPPNTDLNRYFEIMNTRGEQLEQHDIVKADLMYPLDDAEEAAFAEIWNACSDMTGYVQMNFHKKEKEKKGLREALFGNGWKDRPQYQSLGELCKVEDRPQYQSLGELCKVEDRQNGFTIQEIIEDSFPLSTVSEDQLERVRFESVIEFPFFLLHVLKVFCTTRKITAKDGSELLASLLDDKKLVQSFKRVIEDGMMNDQPVSSRKAAFSREFIQFLLQCRFLFDKYIVKREYRNDQSEGAWSLQELKVSGKKSKKKAYYTETEFGVPSKADSGAKDRCKNILMLQSCFRVSYTSPKNMHWITELLQWLCEDDFANIDRIEQFEAVNERIAKRAVEKDFFDKCNGKYDQGVNTPHIVFNYLDYLLWKEDRTVDFAFEFRNSVEHWYPQHPAEEQWSHDGGLDNFGNLCIVQRSVNSRFSNMLPEGKKSSYEHMIQKGSLKLRRMAALTQSQDGQSASAMWRESVFLQHEREMIDKLKVACENTAL